MWLACFAEGHVNYLGGLVLFYFTAYFPLSVLYSVCKQIVLLGFSYQLKEEVKLEVLGLFFSTRVGHHVEDRGPEVEPSRGGYRPVP